MDQASTFPIVAIGASAGGLEAVSEFLAALPASSEMAYVVVQHLDPTHKSLSAEIWARRTALPVLNIEDEGVIEPGHVYVIPPNTTLTINQDRFSLTPRLPGQHHPADILFNSLAEARGDGAIGIVLSGGDSDGSLGVRAIKHSGGITFAQEPKSARFPNMPQNAITTGCIDFVLPPEKIALELERLSVHPYLRAAPPEGEPSTDEVPSEEEQLKRVFRRLRTAHGVDFTHYKRSTLRRRLARRMAVRQVQDLADYIAVMEDDAGETTALYQDFLIRVTGFFRDPEVFEGLRERIFPRLCESRSLKEPIRIWVPGCASGEEVYSIAIALVEFMGDQFPSSGIQIFGTDVSEVEIEKARTGRYLSNISEEMSDERLNRFFVKENEHYRIAKSIRDLCIFARQDVTRDPPFSRLDLLSCRNLLIYFDARAQRHVMQVFHYSLKADGVLMLGPSETVGPASDLFELIDRENRLYTRKAGTSTAAERANRELPQLPRLGRREDGQAPALIEQDSTQHEGDRLLLTRYAPATLFIDDDLNIVQFRGETARFLEHASGPVSNQLQRVVRPELMVEIAPALAEARDSGLSVRREDLILDDLIDVSIEVVPLKAARARNGYLIIFEDASRRPSGRRNAPVHPIPESEKDRRLAQLEREMVSTRDFLQATMEGQEAVKEELKSAHEEVLSANEEFQSTNEELETAKEELQSTNEELTTTNDELRDRNRELSVLNAEIEKARGIAQRARSYADGIVATVRDALVVLDGNLKVLRANPAYYERFEATPEGTEGQPFASLVAGRWNFSEFLERVKATLSTSTDVVDYEMDYPSPHGPRKLLFNARKIVGDSEREQLILLAIEDVTERSQLLEAEQVARTQAERANRAKDEFLATVSHELRTPITIIVGWCRLLIKKHGDTNEELRKSLNLIISNAMGQAQIISDLLDMSSILSGKSVMRLKPVDLRNSVADCVAAHQLQAKEREIALTLEQNDEPAVVTADPARLQQVFGNLLTNAVKFTPMGGRITVRQVRVEDSFEVSVEDTGEGIAPDFLPQIFTRFRQEHQPGDRHGGLGLGLAIVDQIVHMLEGSVTAQSEGRGHGARFTVRLPAHVPTAADNLAISTDEAASTHSSEDLQGITALVVEDNIDMLEFVLRILEERGAMVIGVRTASAALEALNSPQRHSFNVLISDIGLPGIDGYELIRRIRSDLKLSAADFPAIAVTAFGRKEDRQRALDSGYQAHLSKPYEVTHLVATLQKLRAQGLGAAPSENPRI